MKEKNSKNYDLPLVSILLSVYNPNKIWLSEQFISLNNQTYSNIELLVYDDCPEFPLDEEFIKKYITKFPYKLIRAIKNGGSNKAFEELTKQGNGQYFAYCDQDDIWEPNKTETLINLIQKDDSILAYSDMSVIDKNGKPTAENLRIVKPRIKYVYGEKLFSKFFFENCVSGCCMLIKSNIAKKAIPFSKVTIHDQWLCIIGSYYGKISFTDKTLVKYRVHGNNQTGSFKGVYNKIDYYALRVNSLEERINEVKKCIDNIDLSEIEEFCHARINKNSFKIFKYRYLNRKEAYFEILIKYLPNWMFKIMLKKLK